MKELEKKILCVAALALFAVCGALAGAKYAKGLFTPAAAVSGVDWAALYPFEQAETPAQTDEGPAARWTAAAEGVKSEIEACCGERHPLASQWKAVYGASALALGQTRIPDAESPVWRLSDGRLAYLQPDAGDPQIAIDALAEFRDWLAGEEIGLLHVITAQAADERQGRLPDGIGNYCGEAVAALTEGLSARGVAYLDTYELLAASGRDYGDYFYRTDHHWNEQAALAVSRALAERLSEIGGKPVDLSHLTAGSYTSRVYEKMYLGSCGKKATMPYAQPEDFEVLLPTFGSWYRIRIPSAGVDLTGTYENVLLDKSCLGYGYYNAYCYSAFLWGDRPLIRVTNLNFGGGLRVLVIKDSKADVVNLHLTTAVSGLDVIDPRAFTGSIKAFIRETKPDVVVTFYSPIVRSAEPEYVFD